MEYIAAQGPKEETCQHFWQMVFDERVVVIAMVTQLEEAGRVRKFKLLSIFNLNYFHETYLVTNLVYYPITVLCVTAKFHENNLNI